MKNRIVLKFVALTYLMAWSCWFAVIILMNFNIIKYGDILFMSLYLLGGICPSLAGIIAIRKSKSDYQVLKTELCKFKVNVLWYMGIFSIPLFLSGLSWLLNLLLVGKSGPFLTNSIWAAIPMLPVMIIGGGSEEIGWRGVMLPQLFKKMSVLKASLLIAIIWGVWHLPLWFIKGVPQYGSSFIFFMGGTFSLSFMLSIIYIRTRSVFVCILFHAIENAYLNIGLDSWALVKTSSLLIVLVSLLIPLLLFRVFNLTRQGCRPVMP